MFEFVRKHTKIIQVVLFLLIVPSFVFLGIDGYSRFNESGAAVATVDGVKITQAEWNAAHTQELERMRSARPDLDVKLLDSPQARYDTLERLVRERVLQAAAQKQQLAVSDQRLARALQENPSIAALRRPDGSLDMEGYRQLVGAQGMTPETFEARVRADLSQRQVMGGLVNSAVTSKAAADTALNAYFERRQIQVVQFDAAAYAAKVQASAAELEQFYKDNAQMFQSPEQAQIEYLVLDQPALLASITLSEADLRSYYEQNMARLAGKEERRASHILVQAAADAPAAQRTQARERAQALLAQVRKAPDSFAELARKNSQDPGSAVRGGDLDYFARGAMTKPFDDAVFAMKKGDISDVVESEYGYHIIRLTDIRAPKQRSFEDMRPEIETDLKKQQAQRKFAELAEAFTSSVYENFDSLKPTAERFKLQVRTASNVTRKGLPAGPAYLNNPKLLAAIFSNDAVQNKRNTEAVETAPNQLVSARIAQYQAARAIPFDEVQAQVRQRFVAARGAELARKEGAEKLATWKAAPDSAKLPAPIVVSRVQAAQLPSKVLEAALRADPSALPTWIGVDLDAQGYALVRVNQVMPREPSSGQQAIQERTLYSQWWDAAEAMAYYQLLQERYKARILAPKPLPVTGQDALL